MVKLRILTGVFFLCLPLAVLAEDKIEFRGQVLPILKNRCFECHGQDAQESGLRLDVRSSLLIGGDSKRPAIIAGNASSSHLLQLVRAKNTDKRMPPDGEPLRPGEISILERWIAQGANMPDRVELETSSELEHWAFQPIRSTFPPILDDDRVRNPIDAFVLTRLAKRGLTLSQKANRSTLIRRLFLVVTGIAPTIAEVESFTKSEDPLAYENLVDQVLASPRFGERWARHWLDIVRFGETNGFETNRERPTAWHYRDYVIDSLNADKPYNQFVFEQIAGDGVGTGFLVAGPYDLVKSPDINLTLTQRQDELADIIGTTGATFLGLTVGCARCHDHKFDPITQKDYYALQAVFAGVEHGERTLPSPPDKEQQLVRAERNINTIRRSLHNHVPTSKQRQLLIDDATMSVLGGRGVELVNSNSNVTTTSPSKNGLSGGRFTWWNSHASSETFAVYRPIVNGRFRIWITWGVGLRNSTRSARYIIDRDGDESTTDDQKLIAEIDQGKLADGTTPTPGQILSSGPYDAGTHHLTAHSTLLLVNGDSDTNDMKLTADAILFTSADNENGSTSPPNFAPPVNSRLNVDSFEPVESSGIRFTILATNSSQPCIDELEVFSNDTNVALAANGSTAQSSGNLPGYEIHQLKHINDGQYGNSRSWISNENGRGWVQIDFVRPETIDRVQWGRDRNGGFQDRVAIRYKIESKNADGEWTLLSDSSSRLPANSDAVEDATVYDYSSNVSAKFLRSREKLEKAINEYRRLKAEPTAYIGTFKQPGETHRLYRGEPMAKREVVAPNTISSLGSLNLSGDTREHVRRREFANWLVENRNPLTARVMVNRLWQFTFGRGIVATPSDFGSNGLHPSHPDLLDWLAEELMRSNWSLKHVQRLLLTSATFQQSNEPYAKGMEVDAACELIWRFPPRRLEAEAIRDNILAASGVLDSKMGGPGFSGFEVSLENVRHYFPKQEYGPDDWRRMIYMTKVRQEHDSVFGAFDCPDASQVMPKRSRSTTPLQALNLFNSQFCIQQAEQLAERLRAENVTAEQRVRRAFFLLYSRPPSQSELRDSVEFIQTFGLVSYCRAVLNSNEFVFIP